MTPDAERDELLQLRREVARLTSLTDRQTRDLAGLVRLTEDRRFPGLAARRLWRGLSHRLGTLRSRAGRTTDALFGTGLTRARRRLARSRAGFLLGPRR